MSRNGIYVIVDCLVNPDLYCTAAESLIEVMNEYMVSSNTFATALQRKKNALPKRYKYQGNSQEAQGS